MLFINLTTLPRLGLLAATLLVSATADPKLRLTQTAVEVSIAVGSNGPVQTVDAFNAGDGSLAPQVSSTATWATPSIGEVHACTPDGGDCTPIQIALQTSTLAKGPHTAFITVADPNAIDAPQYIVVTVHMGGTVPDMLNLYVYRTYGGTGGSASTSFTIASPATVTTGGAPWLSVVPDLSDATSGASYKVTVAPSDSMSLGRYSSSITVAGSSFPGDNRTFPVAMILGDGYYGEYRYGIVPTNVVLRAAQGAVQGQFMTACTTSVTSFVSDYYSTVKTNSGGNWLHCCVFGDATGLSPGTYEGTVFPRLVRTPGTPLGPRLPPEHARYDSRGNGCCTCRPSGSFFLPRHE